MDNFDGEQCCLRFTWLYQPSVIVTWSRLSVTWFDKPSVLFLFYLFIIFLLPMCVCCVVVGNEKLYVA